MAFVTRQKTVLGWTALGSLMCAFGCNAPSSSSTPDNSLRSVWAVQDLLLNQCLSPSASLVGFSDTSISMSGNGTLGGSVVLLGHSSLALSGNANVSDTVYAPSSNQVELHGNAHVGQLIQRDLTGSESAVLNFANSLDALSATETVAGGIGASQTLVGNGGENIINVDGDIHLSGTQKLTIQGGAQDLFLINVLGNVAISGQAAVVTQGGLAPSHVLFRLVSSGATLSITGSGLVQGTFLAPRGSAHVSGNGIVQGSIFAWSSISISGNGLSFNPDPFCPGNVPGPGSSPSPSPSVSASSSPDPSASPSPDPSASPSPDPSASPSPDPSPSASPSASPSSSPSPSPSSTCGPFCGGVLGV